MRWLVVFFAASLVACNQVPSTFDFGSNDLRASDDAFAYQSCDSICLRPSDCAIAYADDGICPTGFRCALTFSCGDAGMADGGP